MAIILAILTFVVVVSIVYFVNELNKLHQHILFIQNELIRQDIILWSPSASPSAPPNSE